jgi:hypothetical protein
MASGCRPNESPIYCLERSRTLVTPGCVELEGRAETSRRQVLARVSQARDRPRQQALARTFKQPSKGSRSRAQTGTKGSRSRARTGTAANLSCTRRASSPPTYACPCTFRSDVTCSLNFWLRCPGAGNAGSTPGAHRFETGRGTRASDRGGRDRLCTC